MADRLAAYTDFQAFMKNAAGVDSTSEKGTAIGQALDGVSRRMATFITKSPTLGLAQLTSDGVSAPTEFYGTEHYGKHKRNLIRLMRPFNLVSVASINDNGTFLTSDQFVVDYRFGAIRRIVGMFFCQPLAVQVIYTAGYAFAGSGDTLALQVPEDLRNACLKQAAYEFTVREPGGVPVGATTISRPDGSIVVPTQNWLPDVLDVMRQYRR
jgi:hypothetical protein